MLKNKFYIFGILAAITYIGAVVLGGILWPTYSHVAQAISELTFRYAPNLTLMRSLFGLYNVLLLIFSTGLFFRATAKPLKTSAIFLLVCAFSGAMMLFFPQDPLHTTPTTSGLVHLIFAGVASLTTLFAVSFAAAGEWRENRRIGIFSWTVFGIIMLSGPVTAMAPTKLPQYFGIVERVTIGAFIIWLLVYSLCNRKKVLKKVSSV